MKNNVLKFTTIFLGSLLVIPTLNFSCKKDDNEDTINRHLLTSKTWKWSLTDNNLESNPKDPVLYYPIQDCAKDDVISFSSNGRYTIARGIIQCDPKEEAPYVRDYSIDFPNKTFFINGKEYIFLELTTTQFKFAEAITQNDAKYRVYVMVH